MARVLIAAGASGGHVYPALATAHVLRARRHDVEFAGGDRLEARVVPDAGFPFYALPVRRPPSVRAELVTPRGIVAMGSIAWSTMRAFALLRRRRPDVVLGMGGFAGVPVTLAAAWSSVPLVLHEQNAQLSLAQRIPLRWAEAVGLGLPADIEHRRTELVGNPVRAEIAALATMDAVHRDSARREARERLGLDPAVRTLVVLGGSLGSGPLNEVSPRLPLPPGVQVLHLAGAGREHDVRREWSRSNARVVVMGFCERMQDAYAAADLAVSRSGASTVSELALAGLPAVFVPLPTLARGDQEANARVLERFGGAVIVREGDPNFEATLADAVIRLLEDPAERQRMSTASRSAARPDAPERLADLVLEVASLARR